jgi:hypothetical protein
MGKRDADLDRLLRSAASAPEDAPAEPPFGFATRIVALWRAAKANDLRELTRFVRRVAILAIAVTLITSVAAYQQASENEEIGEPLTNDYAIADSAIQTEFLE